MEEVKAKVQETRINEPTVSVLIAVYNAEKWIQECLDSLSRQTWTGFEAICVDDASTDNSLAILTEHARRDPRFRIIHLDQNAGLCHARNVALQATHGDFVCFLDSDDWFSDNALEEAVHKMTCDPDTDCVLFTCMNCYEATGTTAARQEPYPMSAFEVITGEEAFKLSLTWKIHGIYMLKGDLHRSIPYDESSRAYSDDNTTRIHYLRSRHVRFCDGIYYYRQHAASVTHAVTPRRFDYMLANESLKHQLEELGVSGDILNIYEHVRWNVLVDTYMFYYLNRHLLPTECVRKGLSEMKRIWSTIDTAVLPRKAKMKFGHIPFHFSGQKHLLPLGWWLFRMQEECYFFLRSLLGRNKTDLRK